MAAKAGVRTKKKKLVVRKAGPLRLPSSMQALHGPACRPAPTAQ